MNSRHPDYVPPVTKDDIEETINSTLDLMQSMKYRVGTLENKLDEAENKLIELMEALNP
jgi:hypothetical protein